MIESDTMQRREFLRNGLLLGSVGLLSGMEFSLPAEESTLSEMDMRLFRAIIEGKTDVVKALIRNGADVNIKSEFGWTPLHAATSTFEKVGVTIIKLLIFNGADMNAKDYLGHAPLHYAVLDGDVELIQFLVSNGADVNTEDEFGGTPLDFAKGIENMPVVEYLTGIIDSQIL